jgi:hypothetical protein
MSLTYDPGKGRYVSQPKAPKKPRACPTCHSDRESTKLLVDMTDSNTGRPAGKHICVDSWHEIVHSDGRIGGGSRTENPLRSWNLPRG